MESENWFRFDLGKFEGLIVRDGLCPVPGQPMIDVLCLLVKAPDNLVLIDTGCGNVFGSFAGHLIRNLQAKGIQPEDINSVLISHAHSDHIGANTDDLENPAFPNAVYYINKTEWDFWTGSPDLSCQPEGIRQNLIKTVKKNLLPLKDKITKVKGENEIRPGFSFITAPGHTPGNVAIKISSAGENLICLGDTFHHPEEIEKINIYTAPLMTNDGRATREKILSLAVKLKALVFACHFPFPGLGYIMLKDETCTWQPADIREVL